MEIFQIHEKADMKVPLSRKIMYRTDDLMNLVKSEKFLPRPAGSWEVGYIDYMTQGTPETSSFIRLYYPTQQQHAVLPERCPVWTEHDTKHGFINFLQAMVHRWPSWVNKEEFTMLGLIKPVESLVSWAFNPLFSLGWGVLANNPRIPVIHQAQLATSHSGQFPVVVFSHGMGCNRYAYSKVCYDLCSEGYIVAAVEHRDGSACHSRYNADGEIVKIPHVTLGPGDHEYDRRHEQVNQRATEVSLALDLLQSINNGCAPKNIIEQEATHSLKAFKGKMRLQDAFVMGHSFGGATALLAASRDARFKGTVTIDPWMFPVGEEKFSVPRPVLMINTELFLHKNNVQKVREVCVDLSARVLQGAVHLVHTDAPLLFDNELIKSGLGMGCSRGTEEVLKENHTLLSDWIAKKIKGEETEKHSEWGFVEVEKPTSWFSMVNVI